MFSESSANNTFACVICHNRKVRCVSDADGLGCIACRNANIECVPRTRKKRRTNPVSSTARRISRSASRTIEVPNSSLRSPSTTLLEAPNVTNRIPIAVNRSTGQTPFTYSAHTREHAIQNDGLETATPRRWVQPYANACNDRRPPVVTTDVAFNNDPDYAAHHSPPSDQQDATLQLWQSLNIPPRPVRQHLTNLFLEYCNPWLPVLEQTDLASLARIGQQPGSMLLAQAIWFAGSCISFLPIDPSSATSAQFYARVKALLWSGSQIKNLLVVVKAALVMQCVHWDDTGQVSIDDHPFWLNMAITLASRIGLNREVVLSDSASSSIRRRLWWIMVAQDSLQALAYDRPRIININDSDVQELREADFVESTIDDWEDFALFIDIAKLLGDLSQCQRRRYMSHSCRSSIENSIHIWHSRLCQHEEPANGGGPEEVTASTDQDFNARQLKVAYLTALTLFSSFRDNFSGTPKSISVTATIAASLSASIFRTFLEHDEIQYLAPIFTIHAFTSAMALLSLWPYPNLWDAVQPDVQVLRQALSSLSMRRGCSGSANNEAVEALDNVLSRVQSAQQSPDADVPFTSDRDSCQKFLSHNELNSCRLWKLIGTQFDKQKLHTLDSRETINPSSMAEGLNNNDTTPFHCSCHARTAQRLESNLHAHESFAYERFEHWILHGG